MSMLKSLFTISASTKAISGLAARSYATKSLFIGNLSWKISPEDIKAKIEDKTEVFSVHMPRDPLGRSKGFAFVEIDEEEVEAVSSFFNESEWEGRTIRVSEALAKKPQSIN